MSAKAAPLAGASSALASMHPASFALVMATGIVSIATQLLGPRWFAVALLWLNVAFYLLLWSATALRVVRFPSRVMADVSHHGRSVGFFTTVAATCVIGSQVWLIGGAWRAAAALWMFGIFLWAT